MRVTLPRFLAHVLMEIMMPLRLVPCCDTCRDTGHDICLASRNYPEAFRDFPPEP